MNTTAGSLGLTFEPHHQIHRSSGSGSAIEYVADYYEMRFAADPGKLIVQNTCVRERTGDCAESTMNIGDSNNPIDIIDSRLVRICRRRRDRRSQQCQENAL
jgi:hypothetical protein